MQQSGTCQRGRAFLLLIALHAFTVTVDTGKTWCASERERANSLVGLSQSQPSSFLREAALLFSLPSRAELIKLIIIHFKSSHFRVIIIIIKLIIIFIYYVIDNLDCCLFCRCSLFCSLKRPTRWGMGKKRKGGGDMMVGARRVLIQKL